MQLATEDCVNISRVHSLFILPVNLTGLFDMVRFVDSNQIVRYGREKNVPKIHWFMCLLLCVATNTLVSISSAWISTPCRIKQNVRTQVKPGGSIGYIVYFIERFPSKKIHLQSFFALNSWNLSCYFMKFWECQVTRQKLVHDVIWNIIISWLVV